MAGATRWAIAGAGKISTNFTSALKLLPSDQHQVVAVAARSSDRAKEFAHRFNIPNVYGSYKEMAKSTDIDVVYIGTIHTTHNMVTKMFINEGINVLCEKPLTVNARQAKEVISLAREKNVFLMEAVWSRFFPAYEQLRRELKEKTIGEPRFVTANFGRYKLDEADCAWIMHHDLAGGSLLAFGCYNVQFAQMIYNHEKPEKIVATGSLGKESGVDEMLTAVLTYSNQRTAVLSSCLNAQMDITATVCGPKVGVIKIPFLHNPVSITTPSGTRDYPLPKTFPDPTGTSPRGEGMMYQAQAVRDCLLKGEKEHPLMTLDQSLQIQEIMDEIRRQIGLVYKEDL